MEPLVLPDEPLIVPALPVVPVPVLGVVVLELLLVEPGVVVLLTLPLTEPVPVAPIDDVPPEPVVLAVVSLVVLLVLPVVVLVLGDVLLDPPLRLPVVVDGVVLLLDELVAPVPLVPALALRWHARRVSAPTTAMAATAAGVRVVFIRNSLKWVVYARGMGCPDCPVPTLGGSCAAPVGTV